MIKKYTGISEFTAEIVRVFIGRIIVHQANGKMGKNRRQRIDICYNSIGFIEEQSRSQLQKPGMRTE